MVELSSFEKALSILSFATSSVYFFCLLSSDIYSPKFILLNSLFCATYAATRLTSWFDIRPLKASFFARSNFFLNVFSNNLTFADGYSLTTTGFGGSYYYGVIGVSSLTPYLLGMSIVIWNPFSVSTVLVGIVEFNGFYFKSKTKPRP
jgi:hypothetical protein